MNTTVLVFHPHFDRSRINRALADAAEGVDGAQVRYLYDLYPDFAVDAASEQSVLAAADRIVLQFPMYWYSSPALVKQWEDDVLTYGWAYGSSGTALHGKELLLAVSPGAAAGNYAHDGDYKYLVTELLRPFQATSNLIGTRFVRPFVTAGSMSIGDEELAARAGAYAACLADEHLAALGDYE
ncbi:NAD(P)H-dependent oxidoreductase [uncultured Propionibacterium sp.]|uniref:NAD(P)H-dependent oxidoreductase n=1 Tax=uncultured Propionibacterium sp. TaxID=218066 RepID=UPI00292CE540|nr:NAD(P)H-dependent oxidoreductase [uncultured Propionibacterium sp.]